MLWWRLCLLITDFDGIVAHAPLLGTAGDALMGVPGVLNSHITRQSPMKVWDDHLVLLGWRGLQGHSWEAFMRSNVLWIPAKGNTLACLCEEPSEKKLNWPAWGSRKDLRVTPGMTLQVQTTNGHIPKGHWESRACFLWQGVGVMVLYSGDLLEGTDWKSKYAFHLYKTGLHPPPIFPLMQ